MPHRPTAPDARRQLDERELEEAKRRDIVMVLKLRAWLLRKRAAESSKRER
jgi:hypothetical protein